MSVQKKQKNTKQKSGRLRIGDNWNAITIIALSQNNPLKAIAEFVENSIDAKAKNITIIRGKAKGANYLKIVDDGEGIPCDEAGIPNFQYVATHICDSVKRKLKNEGAVGIQGEFGIGLLSFWTVGETLTMSCCGRDHSIYHMHMSRGQPGFKLTHRALLTGFPGTELIISPLLAGLRQVSGEKIQRYLASELRDRIRHTHVQIKVIDHFLRAEYLVEPRQFIGQLIHQLPSVSTLDGEVYTEIYLNSPERENKVGLYRLGTRVLPSLTQLEEFNSPPWSLGLLEGIVDAPFLNLTPGTRDGIIRDDRFERFCQAMNSLREKLMEMIEEQRRAREEKTSREILKAVQVALKEAILSLPQEEYDWFEVHAPKSTAVLSSQSIQAAGTSSLEENESMTIEEEMPVPSLEETPAQKSFFEFPGPLFQVKISPTSCIVSIKNSRNFRAVCRDRNRRNVEQGLSFQWRIKEGAGNLINANGSIATFEAPADPGLTHLEVKVRQDNVECQAEAVVTVTDSILPEQMMSSDAAKKGLPSYTFQNSPGELWRSRYDLDRNVIVINNAHRDFVYASKERSRKLRYVCRLFVKELILANFLNAGAAELLERMVELSLYTEESLR